MTTRQINRAIRHTGLEINRGEGYQYFTHIETGDQYGASVMVCYLNHLPLDRWVEEAEEALENGVDYNPTF
jgi:hypothetical protein